MLNVTTGVAPPLVILKFLPLPPITVRLLFNTVEPATLSAPVPVLIPLSVPLKDTLPATPNVPPSEDAPVPTVNVFAPDTVVLPLSVVAPPILNCLATVSPPAIVAAGPPAVIAVPDTTF